MSENIPFDRSAAVPIAYKLMSSKSFKDLYMEGMKLIEDTAEYLDKDGRQDSANLDRMIALAYASESMRLTTRLMQIASWLLLQRASNDGEISYQEAFEEKNKIDLHSLPQPKLNAQYDELPMALKNLITKADRLQERVLILQTMENDTYQGNDPIKHMDNAVLSQLTLLGDAFKTTK